jgi:hypothetical protein
MVALSRPASTARAAIAVNAMLFATKMRNSPV